MNAATPTSQNSLAGHMLDDLERYRLGTDQPLSDTCLRCTTNSVDSNARMQNLGVCWTCFCRLMLTATPHGRESVEKVLSTLVPPAYQQVEFSTYIAYTHHLKGIQDAVVDWAVHAAGDSPDRSMYLFSESGTHGPGTGNGKTELLYDAFKYTARRRAWFHNMADPLDPTGGWGTMDLNLRTYVIDLKRDVVDEFYRCRRTKSPFPRRPFETIFGHYDIRIDSPDHLVRSILGQVPLLFVDDIGRGLSKGQMEMQLYEDLLDARASNGLPTFMTSNYSPATLREVIGDRAASRALRGNCQVVEVRAPDFSTVRSRLRKRGGPTG